MDFQRKNIKENMPLLIVNFDGLIGDIYCPNLFAGESVIKYVVRAGTEKALSALQIRYQIAVVRQMKGCRFNKFKEIFAKKGIEFDAVYKDIREHKELPQDYTQIIEDFCVRKDTANSVIVLIPVYSEPNTLTDASILDNINVSQMPLLPYTENLASCVALIVPHMKLSNNVPSLEQIAKSVDDISVILAMNKKLPDISPTEKHGKRILPSIPSPEKHGKYSQCEGSSPSFKRPSLGSQRNTYANTDKKSVPPKNLTFDKLFSLRNKDLYVFHSSILHRRVCEVFEKETTLWNRWLEVISKRKAAVIEPEKGKAVKAEMISNLLNSNIKAYTCLHLANQYSKIVQSVQGKLSEAAIAEISNDQSKPEHMNYLKTYIEKMSEKDGTSIFICMGISLGSTRQAELIATEPYAAPCYNLNGFFTKKPAAITGVRKKSYDMSSDPAPAPECLSVTVKRKT